MNDDENHQKQINATEKQSFSREPGKIRRCVMQPTSEAGDGQCVRLLYLAMNYEAGNAVTRLRIDATSTTPSRIVACQGEYAISKDASQKGPFLGPIWAEWKLWGRRCVLEPAPRKGHPRCPSGRRPTDGDRGALAASARPKSPSRWPGVFEKHTPSIPPVDRSGRRARHRVRRAASSRWCPSCSRAPLQVVRRECRVGSREGASIGLRYMRGRSSGKRPMAEPIETEWWTAPRCRAFDAHPLPGAAVRLGG